MKSLWFSVPMVVLGSSVPLSACSSNKNHEERANTPEAMAAKPTSLPDQRAVCIGTCLLDPGSKAVDCAEAEAGLQYEWAWKLAEPNPACAPSGECAIATYTYDDNTPAVLLPERPGWQPSGDAVIETFGDLGIDNICGNSRAVRFRGGPYTEYGGGFGTSFVTAAMGNGRGRMPNLPASPEFPQDEFEPFGGAYDLRDWDGIAIWVRRGPNGQSTLRAGLTERSSAEDLNASAKMGDEVLLPEREGRYCKRYRQCGCPAGTPCSKHPTDGKYYCFDPELTPTPAGQDDNFHTVVRQQCGPARCEEANSSLLPGIIDNFFIGRGCNAAVTSDGLSGSFCYNPETDPIPPAKRERCGNPFSRPINVGLDWQLIRVPFSELRQADEAYVADDLDLASVKQLVFTHTTGWIDFWVANVGFYRARR